MSEDQPSSSSSPAADQQRSRTSKDPLDTAKPEDILKMAKWYFIMGCACLPFMWLVNFVHLYKVSQRRKAELSPSVSTYLWLSLGGSIVWAIAIFTWLGVYQVNRTKWGAFGDQISINLPFGQ
ncbi:Presenilin enhancer-2 subunit of gamma secretase-domain-containing protein [Obelidium mucronatum]|nr:Presenilin enhancer-2 subunit of gamma secretase-domain-containing protein [Obelidium mucronatum]